MPTLSTRVSDGELKAIIEYANASGLSVSDLMKKVLIHKICWLWIGNEEDRYFAEMYCADPERSLNTDEETSEFINKFRKMVGIRALKLGIFNYN